jgi:alkylhydroperoxidase family enzyme
MGNPVFITPGAMEAMQALATSTKEADLPDELHEIVHLRASQINGCSVWNRLNVSVGQLTGEWTG